MGTFHTKIEVARERGGAFENVTALVDTGASYTMLPAGLLHNLGIESHTDKEFTLADGRRQRLPIGSAWIRIGSVENSGPVIFGPEGRFLLGAVTMQILGLIADTSHDKLIPAPELPL